MVSIIARESDNDVISVDDFKFQKNIKCTRNFAENVVKNGKADNVKEAYQYLLNVEKVNTPRSWQNVSRSPSEFVEALIDAISKGYTVRLGIKDKDANTDKDCDEVYGAFLDVDYGTVVQTFSNTLTDAHACFYYYTPSYVEGENEKHRLVFIFDRKATNYEARVIIRWLYKYQYATAEKSVDVSCLDPARLFFPSKTNDDVHEVEFENRLSVDRFFSIAEKAISIDDLNDCKYKCGIIQSVPTANHNGHAPKSIYLSETKSPAKTTPESNNKQPDTDVEESITQQVERLIYTDVYKASGENIQEVFCDIDHNFQEILPDYDDKRKGAVRCWVGLNRWTENKSGGTSFKVSLLGNDRFIYVARGSGGGEKGNDKAGNIINYWFNVFKDEGIIPQDVTEPKRGYFRLTIEKYFEKKGLQLPQFLQKKARQNEQTKGKSFDDIYAEIDEVIGTRLRYNELTTRYELDNENLSFDKLRVSIWKVTGIFYSDITMLTEIIRDIGDENSYHPVKTYLETVYEQYKDSDVNLINNLSTRFLGTTEEIYDIYLKKTMIAAVARIMKPGCKVDTVCVLQGKQGTRKSTFWEVLAGKKYFNDSISFDSIDRDERLKINRFWFHELAELDQIFRRKDINNMRSFITCNTDRYRAPYSKDTEEHERRSILVGTVNPSDFLNDSEGDRRFWAIPVSLPEGEYIDTDSLQKEKDVLWALAYKLYLEGVEWRLTAEEDNKRNEKNEDFRTSDTIEEVLSIINNSHASITVRQIWERILFNQGIPSRGEEMRIADALKKMKWTKKRKSYKGENFSVWINSRAIKDGTTFEDILEEASVCQGF